MSKEGSKEKLHKIGVVGNRADAKSEKREVFLDSGGLGEPQGGALVREDFPASQQEWWGVLGAKNNIHDRRGAILTGGSMRGRGLPEKRLKR